VLGSLAKVEAVCDVLDLEDVVGILTDDVLESEPCGDICVPINNSCSHCFSAGMTLENNAVDLCYDMADVNVNGSVAANLCCEPKTNANLSDEIFCGVEFDLFFFSGNASIANQTVQRNLSCHAKFIPSPTDSSAFKMAGNYSLMLTLLMVMLSWLN